MSTNHTHDRDHSLCKDCFSRLSEYIDRELGGVQCEDVKNHLEHCSCCAACFQTLKKTIELCGCMEQRPVPKDFSISLNDLVKRLGKTDGYDHS